MKHCSYTDIDQIETQEWLESIEQVLKNDGHHRANFLIEKLIDKAREYGGGLSLSDNSPYQNTIAYDKQPAYPGDLALEKKINVLLRWNAMAMVNKANQISKEIGGHIASYASSAVLYEVGFNHFFKANAGDELGDLVYIQGHSSPGIYARAFLEGRLSEKQILNFRQEVDKDGLSSYPHPWLMPDFWQFPTVSMGLGPLSAVHQARFLKYLSHRGIQTNQNNRKVWCFCGDGEMDEPESTAGIAMAAREKLDNLIFVINCNLQRLDGPVRGNGKIIQELEGIFKGAGWNVIKVIWGSRWDTLLAQDKTGLLKKRMDEAVDGDYQTYKAKGGAYTREHFFGKYEETRKLVEELSDEDIFLLNRGGHDPIKVYAAYAAAVAHTGQPTVILAKTVKGFGMGTAGEAANIAHNTKKLTNEQVAMFRDRFHLDISDAKLAECPLHKPDANTPEIEYLQARRKALNGYLPARTENKEPLKIPELSYFSNLLKATGERHISTTMVFVRLLSLLVKDKAIGNRVVPVVPDESRTFGMEGMFRQIGIYSSVGQLYEPMDSEQVMYYREDKKGQIFEEGINEAGAFCSWLSAATSYSANELPMIPFYVYYSMFGFQRIGDLAWLAGDAQAKGFLLGGTAGRTTLAGEGLQHQDGHSHILSSTIPNCISYDPTFAYELVVIIQHGLKRMYVENDKVYYYITVMNENYEHPALPEKNQDKIIDGIIKGMYLLESAKKPNKEKHVQLLGSGAILREVIHAAEILSNDYQVTADIWSVTSFNELRREGLHVERWNTMHPDKKAKKSYVTQCLEKTKGPVIAATDYIHAFADQIRAFVPKKYVTLGTDGFGRSDTRAELRKFFEVDAHFIVLYVLKALLDEGQVNVDVVKKAMKQFNIDPDKIDPVDL